MNSFLSSASHRSSVSIHADDRMLYGDLMVPPNAKGIVLFAHGSGSGRHSPRNQFVAKVLQEAGLATLLMDLLTLEEEKIDARTQHLRFNIPLLAGRLVSAADWVLDHLNAVGRLKIGYFGASTGGGAALIAAAKRPNETRAVVSRGGRPDLAGFHLPHVKAPTLLIVGGEDTIVIDLNQKAFSQLSVTKDLKIIPNAGHLFEEPGAMEQVAELAQDWFLRFL